ncbi:hypothetical protein NPS01_13070 [Nocardioides psychrotolerans]|nr:hypothetical protein NPS01_13070 [Nocardioides psychrotolerans]
MVGAISGGSFVRAPTIDDAASKALGSRRDVRLIGRVDGTSGGLEVAVVDRVQTRALREQRFIQPERHCLMSHGPKVSYRRFTSPSVSVVTPNVSREAGREVGVR